MAKKIKLCIFEYKGRKIGLDKMRQLEIMQVIDDFNSNEL